MKPMTYQEKVDLIINALYFARNNHKMFLDTKVMQETNYTDTDLDDCVDDLERTKIEIRVKLINILRDMKEAK